MGDSSSPNDSDNVWSVRQYATSYPEIAAALVSLRAANTIAAIGGLFTVPEVQANCFRLEILAHMAAAFCRGRETAGAAQIKSLFDALGQGMCGSMEDPSEFIFIGLVNTDQGNFRIFEGLREGNSFYLQRILDVLENAPKKDPFDLMKRSVHGLLRLSEATATRAGVREFHLGEESPCLTLPDPIVADLPSIAARVRFESNDLKSLGINAEELMPFIFDPASRKELLKQEIGNSDLERYPLVECDGQIYLAHPVAVASAITRFVVDSVTVLEIRDKFEKAFAAQCMELIREMPFLGYSTGLSFELAEFDACLIGHSLIEVDANRFLQVILVFEGLSAFDEKAFSGRHCFSDGLKAGIFGLIGAADRRAREISNRPDCLALIVPAGLGRGFEYALSDELPKGWRIWAIPIHDAITASWVVDFDPLTLWRLGEAEDKLGRRGVVLMNQSGILNLAGCAREYGGRLVPEASDAEKEPDFIWLPDNAQRQLRHEAEERGDVRRALDVQGKWRRVQRFVASSVEEESGKLYFDCDASMEGDKLGICITDLHAWWLKFDCPTNPSSRLAFEYWRALCLWLSKVAPAIETAFPGLAAGPVRFDLTFEEIIESAVELPHPKNEAEIRDLVNVSASAGSATIYINVRRGFEDGFLQAENIGDRALVEAMINGVLALNGLPSGATVGQVLDDVCPRGGARRFHRWSSSRFRDFMRERLDESPIVVEPLDHATSLIGLADNLDSWQPPCEISGKSDCTSVINSVVERLVKDIASDLKGFNRYELVRAVVRNHEVAACRRDHWRQASRALVAVNRDDAKAVQGIMEQNAKYNGSSIFSRLLLEAALCESPLDSGRAPGKLDIAALMAKLRIIFEFGGWSDAIYWDAMPPTLRIAGFGEIQANVKFLKTVYEPFSRSGGRANVERAIETYDSYFEPYESTPAPISGLDAEFSAVWTEEFGASLEIFAAFVTELEKLAVKSQREAVELPRSQLISLLQQAGSLSADQAAEALSFITSSPRPSWFVMPAGFTFKDWFPWRFRRRLAILRRPLLQLDDTTDPAFLCAPGLIADSFRSMFDWHRKGEILNARTATMAKWEGRVNNVQRTKFNNAVAARLRELGWQAIAEVKITHIFGRSFDVNYGDVDVLAWRTDTGRILAVECKDLQTHTTIGEVAEQLSDFRGEVDAKGKRDHLKRHLDRLALLTSNPDDVGHFLKLSSGLAIEGHLVFSHDVPMRFAWERMASRVKLSLFSDLENI